MMICLLALLILSTQVLAQPVEGPWEIWTSNNAVLSPEICVRSNDADVLWIDNDSVRYARFSLTTHQLVDGPTAVFALQGWTTQRLHDLVAVNDSTWACLVSEDNWSAPGENDIEHRVDLIYGGNENSSVHALDSSVTHNNFSVFGEYWDEGFSLTPRVGGGVMAAWVVSAFYYIDLSLTYKAMALNSAMDTDYSTFSSLGLFGNPEGNRAVIRNATPERSWLLTAGAPLCRVLPPDSEDAVCYYNTINCEYGVARDFGLTHAGTLLAVMCVDDWNCVPRVVSFEVVDSMNYVRCYDLGQVDLSAGMHASTWDIYHGFALLQVSPSSLELARVDTNGIQFLPTGTLFWRDENHTFTEANVTIADNSSIVAAWTETQDGDTAARRLMLGTVGWDTPLSSAPESDRTAVRGYELHPYPNPFNGELQIRYELSNAERVEVAVYNLLGERVAVLEDGVRSAGTHNVTWTANGSSGIYFVNLKTNHETRTAKVLLAR